MKTIWIIGACLLVGICSACYWFDDIYRGCFESYRNASSISNHGEFGDKYGALNTLFTGLAFVGLIITILLQRKEMQDTRAEFEAQTKQLQKQAEIARHQAYNSALFEYLSYMQERKKELRGEGLDADLFIAHTIREFRSWKEKIVKMVGGDSRILFSNERLMKFRRHIQEFSGWANIVFEWKKYVETSDLDDEPKQELFSRLWNSLFADERCAVVLAGVYRGYIQKNDRGPLLRYSDFQYLCGIAPKPVTDIMYDVLSDVEDIKLEEIVRKHLPEDIIISADAP